MRRKDLMMKLAQTLVRRRSALRKTLAENVSLFAVSDASVGDSIDAAINCEQDEVDSELVFVESCELETIDDALDQINDGRYGTCEACGKPIPCARLRALPYAITCIKCQRKMERLGHGGDTKCHWERVNDEPPDHPNGLKLYLVL